MNNFGYTSSHIANFFLSKKDHQLGNLKLNKLVYISLGYTLALLEKDLFTERIEAWKYGPVIPSLYHEFKHHRLNRINRLSEFFSYSNNEIRTPKIDSNNTDLIEILSAVNDVYGTLSGRELVGRTHQKDSPWAKYYKENVFGIEIPRKAIKDYYKNLIEEQ